MKINIYDNWDNLEFEFLEEVKVMKKKPKEYSRINGIVENIREDYNSEILFVIGFKDNPVEGGLNLIPDGSFELNLWGDLRVFLGESIPSNGGRQEGGAYDGNWLMQLEDKDLPNFQSSFFYSPAFEVETGDYRISLYYKTDTSAKLRMRLYHPDIITG